MCDRNHCRRHVVVGGDDRGRRLVQRQQLLGGIQAGAIGEVTLLNEFGLQRNAGGLKRRLKAFEAAFAGGLVGRALDAGDASMAMADDVVDHFECGAEIIDPHPRNLPADRAPADRDHRHAGSGELGLDRRRFAQRWRQDHPRHGAPQRPCGCLLGGRIVVVPGVDDQLRGGAHRGAQRADQQLAQIGRAGVGVDQRDPRALRRGQRTGGEIRRVVELLDRAQHALTGRFAHVAEAIDDPRDGHRRHACQTGDLADGGGAAFAAERTFDLQLGYLASTK